MLTLRRAPAAAAAAPELDAVQESVASWRGTGVLRVLGAPGTGKSTVAVELVARHVAEGIRPEQCLLIGASRRGAARLRDQVTARVGGTSTEPLARTFPSFGFGVLRAAAALDGDPAPRLLTGPEQDVVIRELLAGHAAGERPAPPWPERVRLALPTRAFRAELRDLLMRAVELGLDPDDLTRLGREHGRDEWVAGADVLREYDEVTALLTPGAFDPAWILGAAADALAHDDGLADATVSDLRLVVVDDAQEMTPAALRLLEVLRRVAPGAGVVLVGDPDSATQTFRGGDPTLLAREWPVLGDGPTLLLPRSHRQPRRLREVAQAVAGHVGVLGDGTHRRVEHADTAAGTSGSVEAHVLRSASAEAGFIASRLRAAHLLDGVPWSEMAVIVRGQARSATLRRALRSAGVPVGAAEAELPVRDEPAVRPFLTLFQVVVDLALGRTEEVPVEVAIDALVSPLGGADPVELRRLRRALRRDELDAGGSRTSDELLAEVLLRPAVHDRLGPDGRAVQRVGRVILAGVDAARGDDGGWAAGVTAEDILWAMWDASRLGPTWRDTALAGGVAGARADRDLDATLALLRAAATFAERLPGATPDGFLEHILGQDVPADTLADRAPAGDSVSLLTPQSAAGREWDHVVVAGVQEGSWPDLRLRGSLLGSQDLVDVVRGRDGGHRAALAAVRHDETRLFHVAVSRARQSLLVTAVRSEDEQPSPYLDVVDPLSEGVDRRPPTDWSRPLTLPALVGALRRDVVGPDPRRRGAAITGLARLARAGVPGADPQSWWVLHEPTDDRPRRSPDASVRLGPSAIEGFGSCQLRWALTTAGGDGPMIGQRDIGTLVHEIAEEGDRDAESMRRDLDERWPRLGLPPGWSTDLKHREAGRMLDRLARFFDESRSQGWHRLAAEAKMRVELGRVVLDGKVDRLDVGPDGAVRVVDYKTGSSKPRNADVPRHGQLGAYQLAVTEGGFADVEVPTTASAGAALLHLGRAAGQKTTMQVQPPLSEDPEPDWARRLVAETGEAMGGATFTATPSEDNCRVCPVRSSCPAQPEGRAL
ncbi:superfamily I DNA/RNA helicase [Knoellia remsis]|uniref:DNA 3'-5' helicase n=1 Tax=Knoellia remsis TaxID=407159 RepID=A0A2T0UYH8_9MICO|nr:ATP-dependent DNA helicase [Knoellia remsis]PRY62985.1 superfamily I DNA/RNA helicase [Knoellia remsis]